jgi:hypothetical protein
MAFYNLKDDIEEYDNLAGRLPEKTTAMKAQLDAILKARGAKNSLSRSQLPISASLSKKTINSIK